MKRRKVQFSDPPVSDLAEIPRTPSQGSLKTSLKTKLLPKQKSVDATAEAADNDSCGLYVATPPLVEAPPAVAAPPQPQALYPALAEASEPLGAVLHDLSSAVLQKLAEKSLAEVGVRTVGDLAKMTAPQASKVKGLMPPNNVATIIEALKKYEARSASKKAKAESVGSKTTTEKKVSPVLDVSTPEEEEKTMKDLYERPSPQPDESEQQQEKQEKSESKEERENQDKEEKKKEEEKKSDAETMTDVAATEAVGTMVNLDEKETSNAEVQSEGKETANAEVQSQVESTSSNAQTEWGPSAVFDVFMGNCEKLSGKQLLAAIKKSTEILDSKMDAI